MHPDELPVNHLPHPFPYWEALEGQVLWTLEDEIAQVKYCPQPDRCMTIKLVARTEETYQLYLVAIK